MLFLVISNAWKHSCWVISEENINESASQPCLPTYRRIHHVKFLAFHGNQLEYNDSQGRKWIRLSWKNSTSRAWNPRKISPQLNELIQSFIKQLTLVVKQCFFHSCNKSDHLQLRPEAAIILQCLRCLGSVTSWNIRLYLGCVYTRSVQFSSIWMGSTLAQVRLNCFGFIRACITL